MSTSAIKLLWAPSSSSPPSQLLDKRRMDHEAELKDIENRFTQMLQHRQQAFDKDVARLREEAEERSSEGVQAAVDRVRSTYAACLSLHPGSTIPLHIFSRAQTRTVVAVFPSPNDACFPSFTRPQARVVTALLLLCCIGGASMVLP